MSKKTTTTKVTSASTTSKTESKTATATTNQTNTLTATTLNMGSILVVRRRSEQAATSTLGPRLASSLLYLLFITLTLTVISCVASRPNERVLGVIERHPGSRQAVARAIKMTIDECQYQMRLEPWDCPVHNNSTADPAQIFGNLMLHNFKETSFIHSLLSSALVHSITRACTENRIDTCRLEQNGRFNQENIEFGMRFAREFMDALHISRPANYLQAIGGAPEAVYIKPRAAAASMAQLANDTAVTDGSNDILGNSLTSNNVLVEQQQQQQQPQQALASKSYHSYTSTSNLISNSRGASFGSHARAGEQTMSNREREAKIRSLINAHNQEVGRMHVEAGMKQVCKCHGLSGACTTNVCWKKLPTFREVSNKLHDSLATAVRIPPQSPLGLYHSAGAGQAVAKRTVVGSLHANSYHQFQLAQQQQHQNQQHQQLLQLQQHQTGQSQKSLTLLNKKSNKKRSSSSPPPLPPPPPPPPPSPHRPPLPLIKRRPVPRSIGSVLHQPSPGTLGFASGTGSTSGSSSGSSGSGSGTGSSASTSSLTSTSSSSSIKLPLKKELIYFDESPNFCVPNQHYNIRGTKGRICSENLKASNSCKTLCCGRGYKREIREEEYNCHCQFKYCCKLECKTCKKKVKLHRCL